MKPEELRLKNLILATWSNEVVEVEEIQYMDDNSPLKKELGEYAINQVAIDQYKPIELSEEWLKKAGATFDGLSFFRLNDRLIVKRKNRFIDYGSDVEFKYVHKLQNFMYEVTGNELIFNHG